MKKNHKNRFAGSFTTVATILALSSASQAQSIYWDTNGTSAGFGNFGATADGTNTLFNTDATGGGGGTISARPGASDNLIIAGNGNTGQIVLQNGNFTVASIDFANTANLAALRVGTAGSNPQGFLTVTGDITDSGVGGSDVRPVNLSAANAATVLVANSITTGEIGFSQESFGNAQFWTTGYNITAASAFSLGRGNSNYTYTQTGGTVRVNDSARGISFNNGDFATVNTSRTHTYNLNGGVIRVGEIGQNTLNGGDNNTNNVYSRNARLEFNDGTIGNNTVNGTLLFQNGLAFNTYDGTNTKDLQYNTSRPLVVALSGTGTHTLDADGATSTVIVTPGAQFVNKTGENGTLTKTGLGNLVFTGGNPNAVNSFDGSTTVNAGTVSIDYNRIAGIAATGATDNLSDGISAASSLILDGGSYALVGRGSASAGSANATLNAGSAGLQVNVGSTAGLVVGQSVTNANLPSGTYIRRILSGTTIELNALSTSITNLTGETLTFGAASFNNTQTVNNVSLLQDATVTVTAGAGTSTTLLSFGDVAGSGKLTKAGAGVLKLTGTISHTGPTAINAGTLEFASASDQIIIAPLTGTASGTLVKSGSGILTMDAIPASRHTFNGAVIVNGGTLANAGAAEGLYLASSYTVNDGGILLTSGDGLGFGPTRPITINAGGTVRGGVQGLSTLTMNGGLLDGTGSFLGVNFALSQDVTVGGSSASTIQGNAGLALNGYEAAAGATRTFNVADATGDASADLTISTVIRNAYGPSSNLTNLQKTGAGTMALSGVNTYTGDTTVLDGTLAVSGSSLHNSTKLVIDGGMVDLTGAETVSTYFIGAVQQAAGTYSANGTELTGSGTLIVTTGPSTSNYAAWQAANSTAQNADLDHDNDGVSNGVEHFLGGTGNTTGFTPLPGVDPSTLSVTWVRNSGFSGFPGNYGTAFVVETSATLADPWTPAVQGVGAGFVEIIGDNVKYTFPAGTKNFARLKVLTP